MHAGKCARVFFKILPLMLPKGEALFTFNSSSFADSLLFVTKLKVKLWDGFVFCSMDLYLDVSCTF